jgi:hypothetical protein
LLYVLEQINLTPYAIYVIIIIEILLIILYAYLPEISDKVTGQDNSIMLLDHVEFLDEGKIILANSDLLKISNLSQDKYSNKNDGNYLTNYCIEMWVYINTHQFSNHAYNKETEIFNYGFTDEKGIQHVKPMIRYYGGGGGDDQTIERNKFVFYFHRYSPINQYATSEHTFYDVTLKSQKWNQIILNYNRNNVDLYINGDLERTFKMNKSMPIYNDLDSITIGEENGIDGAISNIIYYKHPLTAKQIAYSYNSMINSSIPVPRKKSKKIKS